LHWEIKLGQDSSASEIDKLMHPGTIVRGTWVPYVVDRATGEKVASESAGAQTIRFRDAVTGEEGVMTLTPLRSLADIGGVSLGKGKESVVVWTADQTIRVDSQTPPVQWSQIRAGMTASEARGLIGEPGNIQQLQEVEVWWYRYGNGTRKCIGIRDARVFDWK
jgi:hypothetical protein